MATEEIPINVGEPIDTSVTGKLKKAAKRALITAQNFMAPPDIKVGKPMVDLPEVEIILLDELDDQAAFFVRVLDPETTHQTTVDLLEVLPTAEGNLLWANKFAEGVRRKMTHQRDALGFTPNFEKYEGEQWLNITDIIGLATDYALPIIVLKTLADALSQNFVANHYLLVLKKPELFPDGSWKVSVYDPFRNEDRYYQLPTGFKMMDLLQPQSGNQLMDYSMVWNERAAQALAENRYDYTLNNDPVLGRITKLRQAKSARLQIDGYNCGFMVVFMAAMRGAWKSESVFNDFKSAGRRRILNDTSIPIANRKELIDIAKSHGIEI